MSLPAHIDFWNTRYASGRTPWEFNGIPANLQAFLKKKSKGTTPTASPRGSVLIPGCGTGQEIKAFAEAGFEVTAIDFSEVAVKKARELLGPALGDRIIIGDFFTHEFAPASFDFVYERAFLCAFPPELRIAYRDRVAGVLKRGGDLIGYFYYKTPDRKAGAPYGFAWGSSDELFGRHFILLKDVPVTDSVPVFAGRERWQEQRRTAFTGN